MVNSAFFYTFIISLVLFQSCANSKIKVGSEYRERFSGCIHQPLTLSLNTDCSFLYQWRYPDRAITGTWRIHKRSLILESPYFTNTYADKWADSVRIEFWKNADGDTVLTNIYTKAYISKLMPAHKYTENAESDIFLIKGEKLFVIDSTGIRKHCALVKVK